MTGSLPRCGPKAFTKGPSTATASDSLSVVTKPLPYPGSRFRCFRSVGREDDDDVGFFAFDRPPLLL